MNDFYQVLQTACSKVIGLEKYPEPIWFLGNIAVNWRSSNFLQALNMKCGKLLTMYTLSSGAAMEMDRRKCSLICGVYLLNFLR